VRTPMAGVTVDKNKGGFVAIAEPGVFLRKKDL
jgi:hypothetical protein